MKQLTVAWGLVLMVLVTGFGVEGYGGKKTRCFSIPTFPMKVEKVIKSCQDEVKTNLIEDLLFAAYNENPFDQAKHQHVVKDFEDHLFGHDTGSVHAVHPHHQTLPHVDHSHLHNADDHHHHLPQHQISPSHHPHSHLGDPHLLLPDHQIHTDGHHHQLAPNPHNPHLALNSHHNVDPHHPHHPHTHHFLQDTHHPHQIPPQPYHFPLHQPPQAHVPLPIDQTPPHIHHLVPEVQQPKTTEAFFQPIPTFEAHQSLTKLLAVNKPADPHDNHHHISSILEKLRNGTDETSNLKYHRRISKRSLFGKWKTKKEEDDVYHPQVISHEDRWIAGCLMQCVFRKNNAVDAHGYPTLDGLTDLYTAGVSEQGYFIHVLRSVDKCLKGASVKHKIHKGKTPVKGETCDVAFDVFDCVSDSVTEYCSST